MSKGPRSLVVLVRPILIGAVTAGSLFFGGGGLKFPIAETLVPRIKSSERLFRVTQGREQSNEGRDRADAFFFQGF